VRKASYILKPICNGFVSFFVIKLPGSTSGEVPSLEELSGYRDSWGITVSSTVSSGTMAGGSNGVAGWRLLIKVVSGCRRDNTVQPQSG